MISRESEADEPHAGQVGRSIIYFSKKGSRSQIPAVRLRRGVYHPRGAYPSRNPGTRYLCASDKQLEANRQNALQSTGRKTAEGLEPVNNNATRDRLRSVQTVVPRVHPEVLHRLPHALAVGIVAMVNAALGH